MVSLGSHPTLALISRKHTINDNRHYYACAIVILDIESCLQHSLGFFVRVISLCMPLSNTFMGKNKLLFILNTLRQTKIFKLRT